MVNYECVRCHYNSKDKKIMRTHLFARKQCEGIYSNIDLTDEIRDNILTFGTYQENNMLKNINKIEDGYIYVVHTRACIDCNRDVYKIGKTKDYEKRIKGYTKGSIYKLVLRVSDFHRTEQKLIKLCRKTLIERKDYGCEYFECQLINIVNLVINNSNLIDVIINLIGNSSCIVPYTCIRCNYKTKDKYSIRRHFYERKRPCPATYNKIELTDEIINDILDNRIYHSPKETKTSLIINSIQNNNTINNFIKNMESLDKLEKYMAYKKFDLICIEENIKKIFADQVDKLENDKFETEFIIDKYKMFDIVQEFCKIKNGEFEQLNIIYDENIKELTLYKSDSWKSFRFERGLKEVLEILKDYFLDYYEKYLLKKIYLTEPNLLQKQKYREALESHYKFLGCFDLVPYVNNKDNMDILGEHDGDFGKYDIEEKYMSKYREIVDNTKRYEINRMKKSLTEIFKNNTKRNMKELNKNMIELLNIDNEFKSALEL